MENNFQLASASVSDRGLSEKRPQNEDSYLELAEKGIFAVADGVGGAQAGDVASQMAMEILGEAFIHRPETADAEEVMRIAIERANSAIYQMSHELQQLSTMATTIVALHLAGNIATIGHVGDSRLYRIDSTGALTQETDDHSVVAEEVRAGRMTAEQAATHPSRNVISRALGAEPTVDIDLKTMMVEPNTSFVLCSDGITRHIDDWELESLLKSDTDLAAICGRMKELCYERGAEDNLTAVVVKVTGDASIRQEEPVPDEIAEAEEVTVAAARSPFDEVAEPMAVQETSAEDILGVTAGGFETGAAFADEPAVEPGESETIPAKETETIETVQPAAVTAPEPIRPAPRIETAPATPAAASYQYSKREEVSRGGFFSGFLSSLLVLVLGGLLGAAAVYFLFQPKTVEEPQPRVQPPQITEMKTQNIPLTAFEENRRAVDKNPQAFISANASNRQDAADYYLLGRAYLLSGHYYEAKQAFIKAKDRLSTAEASDAKTLATEIAMGLAIINNGPAQVAFANDIGTADNTAANSAQTNADTTRSVSPANANK